MSKDSREAAESLAEAALRMGAAERPIAASRMAR